MSFMPYLNSYTAPFTPGGDAGLMERVPRDQSVQGLTIHFRMDPEVHRRYLHPALEVDPDHEGEALWLYAHHTATPVGVDCSDWHPGRVSANEALLGLVCRYEGVTGTQYFYNFVDTDWDLAVLLFYGYSGKLGTFNITPSHADHAYMNGPRPGAKYVASVDRLGQRVTTARVTLEDECPPEEFPLRDLLRAYGIRHIPNLDIAAGGRPLAYDLVVEDQTNIRPGQIWRGTGELTFPEAENEALAPMSPQEILGAYHFRFSYRTAGVHVLRDFLKD